VECQINPDPRAQAILPGVIELMDAVFPDRIHGFYLLGRFGDGTTVALSDTDLIVLFRDSLGTDEREVFAREVEACGLLSPIRLDITAQSETTLRAEDVRFKLGSVLLAGDDIRAQLPLPTSQELARNITTWANVFIRRLHDVPHLHTSLAYPDSSDAFYGYATVRIPEWYPPGATSGTKELAATVRWTATALLSLLLGAEGYVGTKGEAVRRYRDAGDGGWGSYVSSVYARCRGRWRYEVPERARERDELRALCAQALPVFNHYLETYQAYLTEQRQADDPAKTVGRRRSDRNAVESGEIYVLAEKG
jgi:hypothetical protein